ncbi:HK97 gp10 family phage protein [Nocardioides alcanivorans]|uniref:HK97 gp10 family phage protein n=1 Tax=Nocardioides alcanivorans TaxID=2897352 RepID=UPI001F42EF61|nr:HK97 gp10 family phage protein [Nocardioides alcanivorans]
MAKSIHGWKLNSGGIAELLKSDKVRAFTTARAERVLAAAKASAPVDTGAYRDGLHIEQVTTDRAVTRVQGGTDHDWVVEANTGNLAKALGSAGA